MRNSKFYPLIPVFIMVILITPNLVPATSIPQKYSVGDDQGDVILNNWNSNSSTFTIESTSGINYLDITKVGYEINPQSYIFTLSITFLDVPRVNETLYYRFNMQFENSTHKLDITAEYSQPRNSDNSSRITLTWIANLIPISYIYNVKTHLDNHALYWNANISQIYAPQKIIESNNFPLSVIAAESEEDLQDLNSIFVDHYSDDIFVDDIVMNTTTSVATSETKSPGIFDIVHPLVIVIFIIIPVSLLALALYRKDRY